MNYNQVQRVSDHKKKNINEILTSLNETYNLMIILHVFK